MPKDITLGTARAEQGRITYGRWHAFDHPTGTPEELPIIIVQGTRDGPTFWVTANIHGPELTGIAVIHDLVNEAKLAQRLRGTLVCIPSLSPAGFRVRNRQPYFDPQDPNRLFPDRKRKSESEEEPQFPSMVEQVWARLFEEIEAKADYLIDLHNSSLQSMLFSIRDKVYYAEDRERSSAVTLQQRTGELIKAFGLPAVFEFKRKRYVQMKLHRSTSGAALNLARIPSFTAELGAPQMIVPEIVQAAVNGLHNCLVQVGMLDESQRPVNVPQIASAVPLRRESHPRAPETGLLRHHVKAGQRVNKGDVIATLYDIYGRKIVDIPTEQEGWTISLTTGMGIFKHSVVCNMAVHDDEPLVMKWDDEK